MAGTLIGSTYRMDLRQLRYFVQVADDLHFGRAAQKLHVAQPSLSQQIKLLERDLGIRLFDRDSRSVTLTSAGRIFLPQARAALEQARLAVATATRIANGEHGELAIGFNPSVPLVPKVAAAFREFQSRYPAVTIRWSEETGAAQIAAVASHALDMCLIRRAHEPKVPDGVRARALLHEPLFVACHVDHRLAGLEAVGWDALRGETLIAYDMARPDGFSGEIASLISAADPGLGAQRSVGDLISLIALVIAGLGIAVVPESMRALQPSGLGFVPLDDAQVSIWMVRRTSDLPAPAERLAELLGVTSR